MYHCDLGQKLLERTRARKEYLDSKFAKIPQPTPRKRRSPLKEENSRSNDASGVVKTTAEDDDSPGKRQCVEGVDMSVKLQENVSPKASMNSKEGSSTRSLRANSSDKDVTQDEFRESVFKPSLRRQVDESSQLFENTVPVNKGCSNRLAALAAHINMWEEETQCTPLSVAKTRPKRESSSTPPKSSCESTMSSSGSFKTPSSPSPSPLPPASNPSSTPGAFTIGIETPIVTPKLKINVEEFQKPKTPDPKPSPVKLQQQKTKNMVWDQAIVSTLEAQGFIQSPSRSKLQYDYNQEKDKKTKVDGMSIERERNASGSSSSSSTSSNGPSLPKAMEVERCSVKDLAKKFSSKPDIPKETPERDPAELSLAARVALFEKEAAESSGSRSTSSTTVTRPQSTISPMLIPEKPVQNVQPLPVNKSPIKKKPSSSPEAKKSVVVSPASPSKIGQHTFQLHRKLFEHSQGWKDNEISSKIKEDRQKDMEAVMNRWSYKNSLKATNSGASTTSRNDVGARQSNNGSAQQSHSTSTQQFRNASAQKSNNDVAKAVPVPPPLPGSSGLVANHQMETSESESESEVSEPMESSESIDSVDESDTSVKEDDVNKAVLVLDELLTDSEDSNENRQDSNKLLTTTAIQSEADFDSSIIREAFLKVSPLWTSQEKMAAPQQTPVAAPIPKVAERSTSLYPSLSEVSGETVAGDVPLLHTVSFYRRQKDHVRLTPVRTVVHQQDSTLTPVAQSPPVSLPASPEGQDESVSIQEKIKDLQDEVKAQQIIMGQTSQALGLCRTSEFQGSAEEIEGERLLLIAAQRRLACLNELQRLKTLGATGDPRVATQSTCKGSLSISEIRLPLKADFLESTAKGTSGEFVHFFLCLIKHRAQVIASQMMCTKDGISSGAFHLPNLINVRDLEQDFNIVIEVYGLKTKRDNITKHHQKTPFKREKSRLALTPKKRQSKRDLRMTSPAVQSPGGPAAVCTSNFALTGFATINIKTLQRKSWTLEECPKESPLDGQLLIKLQCYTDFNIHQEGFLTMFEDVGGFGAWHRRWFRLAKRYIMYWKYPDDVKRKDPIGRIDLCKCVIAEIGLVPRDICARPHTFMILTVRPPSPDGDTNTLVAKSHSSYTSLKVLLSADTKEERILWCQNLNKALGIVRAWDPEALRPMLGGLNADN